MWFVFYNSYKLLQILYVSKLNGLIYFVTGRLFWIFFCFSFFFSVSVSFRNFITFLFPALCSRLSLPVLGARITFWWFTAWLTQLSIAVHIVWLCTCNMSKARFPLPELTGDQFPLPVNTGRVDGRPVSTSRVDGPCWRVMETGHTSTRAVNLGGQLG